ncbi:MAG TPA: hypothetical protein VGG74_16920 [Kofleriaceae bacterium]|jgi:hypothetical protein
MKNYVLFGVLAAVGIAVAGLPARSADAGTAEPEGIGITPQCIQSECPIGYVCKLIDFHEQCAWSGSCPSGYYQCPGEDVCMPDGLYCPIR